MARGGAGEFGINVRDLTPSMRQRLGIEREEGVVIVDVTPNGPAAQAGLRRGDVVIEVDRQPVESTSDLAKKLDAAEDRVLFLVERGDATIFVPVRRSPMSVPSSTVMV